MKNRAALDISPYELNAFQELAFAGSISRAAERLGITQPGLSRIVQRVEGQIGVPLLIRTKQGVKLTKTGQTFIQESRSILREVEALREKVRRQETEIEGNYSIGAHRQVAAFCFPEVFAKLLGSNKGLELKIVHDLSRKLVEAVVSHRIDFAIVVDPVRHPDLTLIPLYKDPMCFWALEPSPDESVVIGDFSLKQTEHLLSSAHKRGRATAARVVDSTDLGVVRELTASGAGIGILTKSVATGCKGLACLDSWPSWVETVCLAYRKEAQRSRASEYIKDTIVSCLKNRAF